MEYEELSTHMAIMFIYIPPANLGNNLLGWSVVEYLSGSFLCPGDERWSSRMVLKVL